MGAWRVGRMTTHGCFVISIGSGRHRPRITVGQPEQEPEPRSGDGTESHAAEIGAERKCSRSSTQAVL